jgi:hypothetical protein
VSDLPSDWTGQYYEMLWRLTGDLRERAKLNPGAWYTPFGTIRSAICYSALRGCWQVRWPSHDEESVDGMLTVDQTVPDLVRTNLRWHWMEEVYRLPQSGKTAFMEELRKLAMVMGWD